MPIISIIIPVYNADKFLERCINSLLSQTLAACEFIFVNDGSTDASLSILERYQQKDSRIKVISQENKGVSEARNSGLKVAQGTYIGFVDADDYVDYNFFDTLYQTAEKHHLDITVCNYFSSQDGTAYTSKSPFKEHVVYESDTIKKDILPYFISHENINSIWNKLYRSSLLKEYAILFPKGVALGEDGWFNSLCFAKATKVYFLSYAGYHYIEVSGSATRNIVGKNYFQRIEQEHENDYSHLQNDYLAASNISQLKAHKYITKVVSLLHEYYNPVNAIAIKTRKLLVKELLTSKTTIKIFKDYYKAVFLQKSKYEQLLLFAIRYKLPFIISLVIWYSNKRNKR
ncbi:glycosyltransferase [Flavobacterium sp.]|uniref:glycosyltransferase family 2 protein n=1 Tax=Flavobacterium sp. TaxID=239 RepID=UPI00263985F8|nr:glycosyltransferase [Flavobacterium sp.]